MLVFIIAYVTKLVWGIIAGDSSFSLPSLTDHKISQATSPYSNLLTQKRSAPPNRILVVIKNLIEFASQGFHETFHSFLK